MQTNVDKPSAEPKMDTAYQNEFTEEAMPSPEQRERAAHDLHMDPTTDPGANASEDSIGKMPSLDGGEPDFDDEVEAEDDEDDDDDDDEVEA